jgi:hypothetical protein
MKRPVDAMCLAKFLASFTRRGLRDKRREKFKGSTDWAFSGVWGMDNG